MKEFYYICPICKDKSYSSILKKDKEEECEWCKNRRTGKEKHSWNPRLGAPRGIEDPGSSWDNVIRIREKW